MNPAFSSRGHESALSPELLNCTLADIHGVHEGIDRMQAQVREAMYWLGIDVNITGYVCWCTICTKHKASPPAQPMLPRDITNGPWQEITADYLTHKGKEYLLICNLFSKYPFHIRYYPSPPSHFPCACKSSSPSTDCLACSVLTMALSSLNMSLHSPSSTITQTT